MRHEEHSKLIEEIEKRLMKRIPMSALIDALRRVVDWNPYARIARPRAFVVRDPANAGDFVARVYDGATGLLVMETHGQRSTDLPEFVKLYTAGVSAKHDWRLSADIDDNLALRRPGTGEGTTAPSGDGNPRRVDLFGPSAVLNTPFELALCEENLLGPMLNVISLRAALVKSDGTLATGVNLQLAPPTAGPAWQVLQPMGTVMRFQNVTGTFSAASIWFRRDPVSTTTNTLPTGEALIVPLMMVATDTSSDPVRVKFELFSDQWQGTDPEAEPDKWVSPVLSDVISVATA